MSRPNPNPPCVCCGKPTRTTDFYITRPNGAKLASRWRTECYNVTTCDSHTRIDSIAGTGGTMKEARDDYRRKAAERQEGAE